MAIIRVRYMASLIHALKLACKFIPLAASTVRTRIPSGQLATYDAGAVAVIAFCGFLETVDLEGDGAGEV